MYQLSKRPTQRGYIMHFHSRIFCLKTFNCVVKEFSGNEKNFKEEHHFSVLKPQRLHLIEQVSFSHFPETSPCCSFVSVSFLYHYIVGRLLNIKHNFPFEFHPGKKSYTSAVYITKHTNKCKLLNYS